MSSFAVLEQEVALWRQTPTTVVSVSSLKTHKALQPRVAAACLHRDAELDERQGAKQVDHLVDWLLTHPAVDLEPVFVTDVDGKMYIVDGHHRLTAYRRSMRRQIPAQVRTVPLERAMLLAAVVNVQGEKRTLNNGQRAEATWQWLAVVTGRGSRGLPQGETRRSVALRYGVGATTVHRMMDRLPTTAENLRGACFKRDQVNELTEWPLWRYARDSDKWKDDNADFNAIEQSKVDALAAKLSTLIGRNGPDVFNKALASIGHEARIESEGDDVEL